MICVFVRVWIVAPSIDHIASGNTIRECPAWFTKEWSSSHRERYTQYPDNDDDTIRIRLETQLAKLNEKSHTEETDLLRFRSLTGSRCFIGWTQKKNAYSWPRVGCWWWWWKSDGSMQQGEIERLENRCRRRHIVQNNAIQCTEFWSTE